MTEKHLTNQAFSALGLPEPLLRGIQDAGFEYCTPIQAEALPPALAGQDVAGQAHTGTGKTAAFLLAAFAKLLQEPAPPERKPTQPRAFMLAPTRELAIQIHKDAEQLGKYTDLRMVLVYGGTGYEQQRRELEQGCDVLIGTPGRLIDYFKQGVFDLKMIEVMVMDEADRMFDLGFIRDIRYLLRRMPAAENRLNLLFSATLSHRVTELAYEHMNNPQAIKIESEKLTVDLVQEALFFPANEEKIPLLLGILRDLDATRTLVFVNTKYVADQVDRWLRGNGISAGVLSGDVPQKKRERLLDEFKGGSIKVMVATDVAARGLHIPDVSHVINYDLPQDAEDYVHRIGRTARAGASGDAISFVCEKYAFSLLDIEEYAGHKIPVRRMEEIELVRPQAAAPPDPTRERRRPTGKGGAGRKRHPSGDTKRHRMNQPRGTGPGENRRPSTPATAHKKPAELQQNPPADAGRSVSSVAKEKQPQPARPHSRVRETPAVG